MQTFRCMNSQCAKPSAVRRIKWHDQQHIVECGHCRCYHALRLLETE